MKTKNTEVIGR